MRTTRGLQITSIVVLSPVLLVIISLISVFACYVYSCLSSFIIIQPVFHQKNPQDSVATIMTRYTQDIIIAQQQQQQQQLQQKKWLLRFKLLSLRKSPTTWLLVILLYAIYIIFKKIKKCPLFSHDITIEQPTTTTTIIINNHHHQKKGNNKKKRTKKIETNKRKNRQQLNNVNKNNDRCSEQPPQNSKYQTSISVNIPSRSSSSSFVAPPTPSSPTTATTVSTTASTTASTTEPPFDLNLISPAHTDDEQDKEQQPHKCNKNWYSPFSTGLDLDILVPHQITTYSIGFNNQQSIPFFRPIPASTTCPYSSFISHHNSATGNLQHLLQIHPFIHSPSSLRSSKKSNYLLGSIGDVTQKQLI